MQRALFLCPSPFEVGTYFRAFAFAKYLIGKGMFDVDLVCTSREPGVRLTSERIEGVNVIQTGYRGPSLLPLRGWNPAEIWERLAYVRTNRLHYDLVYSFEYQPNVSAIAFPLAKRMEARHFNDWCDWYAGRHHRMKGIRFLQALDGWMEEYPRKRVECVTTICSSLYQRALQAGVPEERLLMIREGAETPSRLASRAEARRALGIDPTEFLVVSIHDQDTGILEAGIENLAQTRPGSRLVLIGNIPASIRPRSNRVHMPGRVSNEELHLWLCAADCAWLPMADTPLNQGRVPHKAGHFRVYGLPLVLTRVSDLVGFGDPGMHFADFDGKDFARVTQGIGELEDEVRRRSIQDVESIFGWDRILEPLAERLQSNPK